MKQLITLILILSTLNVSSQVIDTNKKLEDKIVKKYKAKDFFKKTYKDIFKYSTVYVAGNVDNPKENPKDYFVRTNPDGNLYAPPVVVDGTDYYDFDYRYGVGIRKLARFDYEIKGKHYYDGTENNIGLSAPNSPVSGLEYTFHYEKERSRDEEYKNHRYFIKHSGDYHVVKLESRKQGKVDFNYKSAEVRAKLPIGKKISISAGAIYRTHVRPYGYNPVEIWLNETNEDGWPMNPWYSLGFEYGYDDIYYTQEDQNGNEISDWYWINPEGEIVAHTDLEFRDTVFADLMNRFNNEIWSELDVFGVVSPIVGFDVYHYKSNFWLHAYGSYLLPYHKYVQGDESFSYLNRNNWGLGGLIQDSELEQWEDWQAGVSLGWRLSKSVGVFIEGEYTKFWDSEIYQSSIGVNFRL
tara:strand:+ start:1154 stop:2383 length:1230 start_codon:yes stop_codon:yes gene_type:complete